jgi:hypothetical protein
MAKSAKPPARKKAKTNSTLLSQGFSQDKSTSYIDNRVALTDEVYAKRDRVEGIVGYHYIYTVASEIRTTKDLKLDLVFLNKRVKADSPKSVFEPHYDDPSNRDAEEHIQIDLEMYAEGRKRYKEHSN